MEPHLRSFRIVRIVGEAVRQQENPAGAQPVDPGVSCPGDYIIGFECCVRSGTLDALEEETGGRDGPVSRFKALFIQSL
ncbi:hypothetical protein EDC15_11498 [Acetobacter aceti NBRC 14818]|nr:hypothetical protein EDC15_11498 [Acetobacter aceti NBRC 14818]